MFALMTRVIASFLPFLFAGGTYGQVVLVSDPAGSINDPEFDQVGYHITWQDVTGNLWLASVDPLTGDIVPSSGKGQLLDTGLYPFIISGNGPEWSYGKGKANIVYTVNNGGKPLLRAARANSSGVWGPVGLSSAGSRSGALGSPVSNSGPPMIAYKVTLPSGHSVAGWRSLYNASSELMSTASRRGGRFVDGGPGLVTMSQFNAVPQIAWIDTQTKAVTQLTFDPGEKVSPFMWWAPELAEYLVLTVVDSRILAIYREIGGQWQRYLSLTIPSRFEFLTSPEVLVVNGVSYFAIVAAERLEPKGALLHWPAGRSEIWIGGIDPANPFFRRVDDPTRDALRLEPEFLVLSSGVPILYYSEQDEVNQTTLLFRAATGLGE
jgi:hypothetical protein